MYRLVARRDKRWPRDRPGADTKARVSGELRQDWALFLSAKALSQPETVSRPAQRRFSSDFWLRGGKFARNHGVGKTGGLVRTVAERFVRGVATTAQADGGAPGQAEGLPLRIHDLKIAFDLDRPVVVYGDFGGCHLLSV